MKEVHNVWIMEAGMGLSPPDQGTPLKTESCHDANFVVTAKLAS